MPLSLAILALRAARIPVHQIRDTGRLPGCRILASLVAGLLAGCGTPGYKLIKPEEVRQSRMAPVEVKAAAHGIEFTVAALIVMGGPGEWKHDAYWDEYVVRITNHRAEPAVINAVAVHDVLDRTVIPGTEACKVDEAGRKHELHLQKLGASADARRSAQQRRIRTTGDKVAIGAGVLLLAPVAVAYPPALVSGAIFLPLYPFVAIGNQIHDPKNKPLVEAEFNRRRLELPVRIEPGASVEGSVFFPLTPGPESVSAWTQDGAEIAIPLPGLEKLHFTRLHSKAALKAAKPARIMPRPLTEVKEPKSPAVARR
jgi:hypothetical protein